MTACDKRWVLSEPIVCTKDYKDNTLLFKVTLGNFFLNDNENALELLLPQTFNGFWGCKNKYRYGLSFSSPSWARKVVTKEKQSFGLAFAGGRKESSNWPPASIIDENRPIQLTWVFNSKIALFLSFLFLLKYMKSWYSGEKPTGIIFLPLSSSSRPGCSHVPLLHKLSTIDLPNPEKSPTDQ